MSNPIKIHWDERMLATLRTMRAAGSSWFDISLEIGVAYATTILKAREIGLSTAKLPQRAASVNIVRRPRGTPKKAAGSGEAAYG